MDKRRHGPPDRGLFAAVDGSWKFHAACRGADPELFFPHRTDVKTMEIALGFCARCPVTVQCLEEALRAHDEWGIRGGMTGRRRRALMKECLTPAVA